MISFAEKVLLWRTMSVARSSTLSDIADHRSCPGYSSRTDYFRFVAGSASGITRGVVLKGEMLLVFQPCSPFQPGRHGWLPASSCRRVFSARWASCQGAGTYVPRTLLNSEGWDVVDKLPSFLTLCGDNSEACPQGGSPAELSPNCPQR